MTEQPAMPFIAIVTINGLVELAWPCESEDDGLRKVRQWYAIKKAINELSGEAEEGNHAEGPDPRTATEEQIAEWFAGGGTDVVIDIREVSPDPLTRELEAVSYLAESKRRPLEAAARAAASIFD